MRSKKGGCSNFVTRSIVMLCKHGFEELSLSLSFVLKGMNAKTCLLKIWLKGDTQMNEVSYVLLLLCILVYLTKKGH